MWKSILFMLFLCGILGAGIMYLIPIATPDFSRQGKQVLINGLDSAVIVNEEKPLPEWSWIPKRQREVLVKYKDNAGIYHEESFSENQITELETTTPY